MKVHMGSRVALAASLVCALLCACTGTTGYDLVTFGAAARGPSDAVQGQPYAFDAGGEHVTLTQATLHVGALYLTQAVPTSGGGPAPCSLPGTYDGVFVGEVRGGADIDLLNPSLQPLSVQGDGSTIPASTGQVWLMHGDVNAATDPLPILTLQGTIDDGVATETFSASITIDDSRQASAASTSLPGENPVCLLRIVSGIPVNVTLAQGGTLVLDLDPKALFENANLAELPPSPDCPTDVCFTNDDSNQPSVNLFQNLTSAGGFYRFEWLSTPLAVSDAGSAAPPSSCVSVAAASSDAGFSLQPAPCVNPSSIGADQLLLTASGEILAVDGYTFPDPNGTFADGWAVSFTHYIATFDKVSLWNNPDMVPTDQSQHGSLVAELDGPWAVDMHLNGAGFPYIEGKEQGERAVAFAVLPNQNKNGGAAFPTDGTRLGVGFSAVEPTPSALNVNLDADGLAAYQYMIANQCTVYYSGTATWEGASNGGVCVTPSADAGTPGDGTGNESEFANIPQVVNFILCYRPADLGALQPGDPETSWINCDNQDNDPAPGLNGEPHERGIAFTSNTYSVGEVTFHTDHPFWESTKHDTPARFDAFAAQTVGLMTDGGIPTVTLDDEKGVDYTGFTDRLGNVLPWRTCDPMYQNPNGGSRVGPMHYDPVAVPHCTNGDHATGLCDFYDFSKYNQSTQGHWNGADGLCFVQRHYASPP